MPVVIFIGLIIGVIWLISYVSKLLHEHNEKIKEEVFIELTGNTDINDQLVQNREFLNEIGYIHKVNNNFYYDKTPNTERIGICPKCKQGYLRVRKQFVGYDAVYRRYPQYNKYLGCSNFPECKYTEHYNNVYNRKNS